MTSRELSGHNPRPNTVEDLITRGLGYCCEWFFWKRYTNAEMIASRLGVTVDTVRRHKLWFANGKFECKGCEECLDKRLKGKL